MTLTDLEKRPTGFVYVDLESTGLDRRRHHPYELAYAVDDGPIWTLLLPHTLRYAEQAALEVGRYFTRGIPVRLRMEQHGMRPIAATLGDFVAAFAGPDGSKNTLVAANPAFDTGMLFGKVIGREAWTSRARRALHLPAPPAPAEPWHYRLLDIEAYAAGLFGWPKPAGLRTVRDFLVSRGYDIPAPDHSAAGDVATLRAVHYACWDVLGKPYANAPRIDPRQEPVR